MGAVLAIILGFTCVRPAQWVDSGMFIMIGVTQGVVTGPVRAHSASPFLRQSHGVSKSSALVPGQLTLMLVIAK